MKAPLLESGDDRDAAPRKLNRIDTVALKMEAIDRAELEAPDEPEGSWINFRTLWGYTGPGWLMSIACELSNGRFTGRAGAIAIGVSRRESPRSHREPTVEPHGVCRSRPGQSRVRSPSWRLRWVSAHLGSLSLSLHPFDSRARSRSRWDGLMYSSNDPASGSVQVLFWATVVGLLLQVLAVSFSFEPRRPVRPSFAAFFPIAQGVAALEAGPMCRFGWGW